MADSKSRKRPVLSAKAALTAEGTLVRYVWMLAGSVIWSSSESISERIEALLGWWLA